MWMELGLMALVFVVLELQDMDWNILTSCEEVLVGLRLVALVSMVLELQDVEGTFS